MKQGINILFLTLVVLVAPSNLAMAFDSDASFEVVEDAKDTFVFLDNDKNAKPYYSN